MTPNKFSGYSRDGRRLYHFGGGGNDSPAPAPQPTTQTVNQTNIPDYARPYVEDLLGRSQALTTQNTYQPYGGQRVNAPTQLQNQAYAGAGNMTISPWNNVGEQHTHDAMIRAQQLRDQPYNPATFNGAVGQWATMPTQARDVRGPSPVSSVQQPNDLSYTSTQGFNTPGVSNSYMNPYMQQVVDIQKREATRNSAMMGQQQGAQAVGAGAFGGSRDAIVQSERERNLGQQLGDIQSQGSNAAWQQAQQAFQSDASRNLQSQQGNQQALLGWGGQNIQGQMANQQAQLTQGQQSLQGQQSNQNADLTRSQQTLAAQQANQQQNLGVGAQGLQAAQQAEQSRQFGSQYGLEALRAQMAGANQLLQAGQQDYNQQMGIYGLQDQLGTQQQSIGQQQLDANYQEYQNAQRFPYQNLDTMSSIIHGLPLSQTSSAMYQAPPSTVSQLAGLGTAAYGFSRMAGMKRGGMVRDAAYADGGDVIDVDAREVPHNPEAGLASLLISQIH